jgi:hypothetical protein
MTEEPKDSELQEKANQFFSNLEIFLKLINKLKSNKNLIIYGFGEVGYLVFSNLPNIKKIIDQNYTSLLNRYNHINKFYSENDININDEILITAFGREKNIINSLEKINIKYKKIISIENLFPYNTLKFANNITKLLYNIDSLNRLSIEKKYKLFISNVLELVTDPLNIPLKYTLDTLLLLVNFILFEQSVLNESDIQLVFSPYHRSPR